MKTSLPLYFSFRLFGRLSRLFIVLLSMLVLFLYGCQEAREPKLAPKPAAQAKSDPLNTTYYIQTAEVTLVEGRAEEPAAPGASSKIITQVWGAQAVVDMNKDGTDDAVLILTQSTGGSGTFYYVVVAIATDEGYQGSSGLLLGDRIKPEGIEIMDAKARVRFLARGAQDSFADGPTVARQMDVIYVAEGQRLAQVAIDFEGEADPKRMALQNHIWTWIKTAYSNDTEKAPREVDAFTLKFTDDDKVQGTTDCNSFQGGVNVEDNRIRFAEDMAMTRKYCEVSQEMEFIGMLQNVSSFFFTSKGELIMELKYESGSIIFKRVALVSKSPTGQ